LLTLPKLSLKSQSSCLLELQACTTTFCCEPFIFTPSLEVFKTFSYPRHQKLHSQSSFIQCAGSCWTFHSRNSEAFASVVLLMVSLFSIPQFLIFKSNVPFFNLFFLIFYIFICLFYFGRFC
jgi:hypothetical protein